MTASWGDPTQPLPQPETRRRRLPETVPTTVLMPPAPPRMPVAPPPPLYYPPLAPPDQPPLPPAPGLPHPRRGGRWFRRGLLLATVALVIVLLLFVHRASDFGTAISTQAPFTTQLGRNGRVNLVFLGYGGAGHDGPYLTDSLLVVSYRIARKAAVPLGHADERACVGFSQKPVPLTNRKQGSSIAPEEESRSC